MATYSSSFACEIPWTRGDWQGYSSWGHEQSDTTERLTTKCISKFHFPASRLYLEVYLVTL